MLSIKQNSSIHTNGHDDQPVRRSIDLTSMFSSEKVIFDLRCNSLKHVCRRTAAIVSLEPNVAAKNMWRVFILTLIL